MADGATRLWKTVAKRKADEQPAADRATKQPSPDNLPAQVAALQASVAQLKDEMQAATELIKDLAEQNAALIQRVELNRRRLQRQTAALAILFAVLAAAYILSR